jgi:single-strand DNA-binding protein
VRHNCFHLPPAALTSHNSQWAFKLNQAAIQIIKIGGMKAVIFGLNDFGLIAHNYVELPQNERSMKMSAFAQISGRLGYGPELKYTNGGTPVVNLSVANNRTMKVGDIRKSVADWFKIVIFGRQAEIIAQYAKKGSALAFNGQLQIEKYVDREGIERVSPVLIASSFEFLPSGKQEEASTAETVTTATQFPASSEDDLSDIPF